MKNKLIKLLSILSITVMLMTGCTAAAPEDQTGTSNDAALSSDSATTSDNDDAIDGVGSDGAGIATTISSDTSEVIIDKEFTARDIEVGYEASTATNIKLNGSSIVIDGKGAAAKDNIVTITEEGSFVVEGTLTDGQIIIDAGDKDKVQLILNGASITCSSHAPIYIKNADKVFLTLIEGSKNSLADGANYVQIDENEVDAVLYSKADLTLNGTGSLTIYGNYKHGIASKDDLIITGGNYHITAVKDALNGKDCVKIKDGSFTLDTSTGNGIQSKNSDDSSKGYVYISGGTINITNSYEGIEGTAILIEDGTIVINASDDGLNATSASSTATTTLKAPETRDDMQSGGPGAMKPGQAPEGKLPQGGVPSQDQGNFPARDQGGFGKDNPFEVDENSYISISGGTITINAEGDGIDSNGSLYISGGTVLVNGPTSNGNGSLDYNGTAKITGGVVVAVGSSGMAQGFDDTSTQCSLLYVLSSNATGGSTITLKDKEGKEVINFTPDKAYQSVVISSPNLIQGETYTLTCDSQSYEIILNSIATSNNHLNFG